MTSLLKAPPKKLCILRLSALGDVCHVLPVIHSLQQSWPEVQITWVIGKLEHKLVGALPGVEFVVYDKKTGRAGRAALRDQLRGRDFDALLLMQLSFRANLLSRVIPARLRLGYDRARSKEAHGLFINARIPEHPPGHVAETLMQFAVALGAKPRWEWSLPIAAADRKWAQQVRPPGDYVVLSPNSSHALRNWSVEGYAQLADHLQRQHGLAIVICGGPSPAEIELGAAIEQAMQGTATNLVGQDTLRQFLALLESARLLITPDSGPAHFAAITDTPVLGLYAATDPARSGPFKWREHAVNAYPEAARNFLSKAPKQLRWGTKIEREGVMDLIEIRRAIEAADDVLAASEATR